MSQSKVAPAAANFAANPSLDDPHVSNISKDDEGEKFDRALGADVLMLVREHHHSRDARDFP